MTTRAQKIAGSFVNSVGHPHLWTPPGLAPLVNVIVRYINMREQSQARITRVKVLRADFARNGRRAGRTHVSMAEPWLHRDKL